ncbi:MAG: hypothetical protein ACRDKJ_11225 [Actinomycetota bacterium]
MPEFSQREVRVGESIARIRAHHEAALELLRLGRLADARLQATRPITNIVPDLAVELRACGLSVAGLSAALAGMAWRVRRDVSHAAGALGSAAALLEATLQEVAGGSVRAPSFRASVVVALVERAARAYRRAVESGELDPYQEAYALGRWVARDRVAEQIDLGDLVLDSPLPPAHPVPVEAFERSAQDVREALERRFGVVSTVRSPLDDIERVVSLLDGVVGAYRPATQAAAARLASEAFVRVYTGVRDVLAERAPRLAEEISTLGAMLRVDINAREPEAQITSLVARAKELLGDARGVFQSSSPRDKK